MMIHLIGGEKGGIGKSLFARILSQYMLDRSVPFIGLDADQSHTTLTRYYQSSTQSINLDYFESADRIMEIVLEEKQSVLVDLPAQSQRFLDHWLEQNGVLEMCEEMKIMLVFWYVVDDGVDSAQLLEHFWLKYRHNLGCIVVKNEGRGNDFSIINDLEIWENEENYRLQQIALPALHGMTMHKINRLNFSFWAAANHTDKNEPHLNLMERQRTKVWRNKVYKLLDDMSIIS